MNLTRFQVEVLRRAAGGRNGITPVDEIGYALADERRAARRSNGASVANVSRASYALEAAGLAVRLVPRSPEDPVKIAVTDAGEAYLRGEGLL